MNANEPMLLARLDQNFAKHSETLDVFIQMIQCMGVDMTDSRAKFGVARMLLSAGVGVDREAFLCWLVELLATATLRLALLPTPSDPLESGSVR